MRVLVTGGAGYIGSHIAKLLAVSDHDVVVVDSLDTGHDWAVKWGPLVQGSIEDPAVVRTLLRDHQPEAVIHLAAHAYVGESMQRPTKYFLNNVAATLSLLEAIVTDGVRPFVFSSTCAVYGLPDRLPIDETANQNPVSPYGESKLMVEKALGWLGEIHRLPWMALRYFNAAGADPDGELGELHDPETHLIPKAISAATGSSDPLRVFGTDYPTPDGSAIRDFIHVSDLADAHVRALEYLANDGESVPLNLGTGIGHSVREVVAAVEAVAGRSVPAIEVSRRPGDPPRLVADASRAVEVLGWRPVNSELETIVRTAWEWSRNGSGSQAGATGSLGTQ